MKYALIGNCQYQALIDDRASVVWLCWPRFDSSFVFGSMLDADRGGEFSIAPRDEVFESEQTYMPFTNIVVTRFTTQGGAFEVVDFAPRFLQYERSFKPTMLIRRVRRLDGNPSIRVVCRPVYDYGREEPGYYVASNHVQWLLDRAQLRLTSNAPLTYVTEGRPFVLTEPVYLVLTWGKPLEAPLAETCESFLAQTRRYWTTWVKHASLPERFQEPVIRSALTLKLHQFEDTGAITAATTTSIPEYPGSGRTWDYRYCWLRDSCFTLGALRRLGHFEEMERFITYLHSIGESAGDRLQPVYGISGQDVLTESVLDHLRGYRGEGPVRVGNHAYAQVQHDVYGEMIAALAPLFLDVRFRDYADSRSIRLLHTLLRAIETHLEAPDAGLWEKRHDHRLHTFSLLMHWLGASTAGHVGARCGDSTLAEQGHMLAERARAIIEKHAWRPGLGCYSDVTEGDTVDASLMLMVNLGYVPPGHPHAESHVLHLASQLGANDHLLHRYRHHDGIGDTHATFTMCGLWHAEALARIGRVRDAEQVFTSILGYANHVGLLSEDIDPATGEQWGNFPQTYSHVGLINAAFAISPMSGPVL